MGAPCSLVTVTNTFTSRTSTLIVVSGSWPDTRQAENNKASRTEIFIRGKMLKGSLSFGCWPSGWQALGPRNIFRERLAVGPDSTILKVLFFPDRYSAFEGVDEPTAGVKS